MIAGSKILKENKVKDVYVAATHGIFPNGSLEKIISSEEIREVVVTNSLPIDYKSPKLKIYLFQNFLERQLSGLIVVIL